MVSPLPLVSIICPAYNHEQFIAQTLDGFVAQQTKFPFEIIVHDDASTDNTVKIIKEYEAKHPQLFANIYQTENQFSKSIGNVTQITFAAARGKYLAICEGDDYWTDPLKLQKQVDFLEANKDYSICCTNAYLIREGNNFKLLKNNILVEKEKPGKTIEQDELLFQNCILTLTVVFRNNFSKYPGWMQKVELGDWSLHILHSFSGKIMYLDDVTAAYRIHSGGMFSMSGNKKQLIAYIKTGEIIRKNIDQSFSKKMLAGQRFRLNQLLSIYKQENAYNLFLKYFLKFHFMFTLAEKAKHLFAIGKLFTKRPLIKMKNVTTKVLHKFSN